MEFRKVKVELTGFKYPVVYLREMSIRQLNELYKGQSEDKSDLDMLLDSLKYTMVNEAGDNVITEKYTIDDFADEIPQSCIFALSDAFSELNGTDEEQRIEIAKNS